MLPLFDALDRACDTLAHLFDGPNAPEAPRSRPEAALFMVALALVPFALLLVWEGSPWMLALWGAGAAVVCLALVTVWGR